MDSQARGKHRTAFFSALAHDGFQVGGMADGPRFVRLKSARVRSFAIRSVCAGAASLGILLAAGCGEPPPAAVKTQIAALAVDALDEVSGLAVSRRAPDIVWTNNDSDGQPVLYALGLDGKLRGRVRVAGVKNIDWEDMASFQLDGRAWLLIADTGDNGGNRRNCALHVIAEPEASELDPQRELSVSISWSIPVRYENGPHDCESVAVDVREGLVYLLQKRILPNPLFVLPLRPAAPALAPVAKEVAKVGHIPQPNSQQRAFPVATGRWRGNPTAIDIAADGLCALVLTYGDVLLFPRQPGETWARAFSRRPIILPAHGLEQAEAACFSADGKAVFVTEERLHAPLLRYDLAPLPAP